MISWLGGHICTYNTEQISSPLSYITTQRGRQEKRQRDYRVSKEAQYKGREGNELGLGIF